jgi:hypothetical protein
MPWWNLSVPALLPGSSGMGRRPEMPSLRSSATWLTTVVVFTGFVAQVHAADVGVAFLSGTAAKTPSYTAGVVVALPGALLGNGLAVGAVVSRSEYSSSTGSGTTVTGRSDSVTLSARFQSSGTWGYATVGAGGAYHHTRLRPDDPSNPNRGSRRTALVGGDGVLNLGRQWQLGAQGDYRFSIDEYYSQADLTRAVSRKVRLGIEGLAQGDPTYERRQYGVVMSWSPSPPWGIRLSGGNRVEKNHSAAYGALSISRVF